MKRYHEPIFKELKEKINVEVKWTNYDTMTILEVTRHRRYVELIVVNSDGECNYIKCNNRQFVNLVLDGGIK